ncbi:hypothetical protein PIB30_044201 [Stylosanthes scabra]|uniref:Uncharacterized protein n=1 Tax=Stylosanthes scabra TaxID=79078 RepID=A0ABU6SFN1_9FABA|nr:hypothetical protein [Stylosanthes scabra]
MQFSKRLKPSHQLLCPRGPQDVFKKAWGTQEVSLFSIFFYLHFAYCLFISEMAKKKSCENVRNPHVLSPIERELYGWVVAEVFTQSSVLTSEHLPKLRREMRLAQDPASEGDFVLEVAGPSDRLPFQVLEDMTHFLWVYAELFTRLGVQLPFSDFQREVLTRC